TVCINNIALQKAEEKLNIDECQKLDNTLVSVESCVFEITAKKALSEENPALCSAIVDTQSAELCMLQTSTAIALKKDNPNVCKNFGLNQSDENRCYNAVLLVPKVIGGKLSMPIKTIECDTLTGSDFQKDCRLFQSAILRKTEGSLGACSKMSTEEFRRMCSASAYVGN
ncbi:MAG: hypothetical protein Q7J73_07785, partial [Dehalococcoidales bacterium]|nr:hypothetical protein [Dehalococcoidales bacterium]